MLPEVRQTVASLDGPIIEKQFHAEPLPQRAARLGVRQLFQRNSLILEPVSAKLLPRRNQ